MAVAVLTLSNLLLPLNHTALRLGVEGEVVQSSQRVQHEFFVQGDGERVCEGCEKKQQCVI